MQITPDNVDSMTLYDIYSNVNNTIASLSGWSSSDPSCGDIEYEILNSDNT